MKFAVLGSGLMGRAVAYDLLSHKDTSEVILADNDQDKLSEVATFLDDSRVKTQIVDAANTNQIKKLLDQADGAVAAVHYDFNFMFTEAAIETGTHLCDLGGNSEVVDKQLKLDSKAVKAGISVIPDCGLAPGMVAVLVKWGLEKFDWVEAASIRVGGLPIKPTGSLQYGRLFSVEGLINEYIEPVRVLRNGQPCIIEPLAEIEHIDFPEPYGLMEAFTTSGGTSTLVDTYRDRLINLDYKTIRYPGHCKTIRAMYELGMFSSEPVLIENGKVVPRQLTAKLFEKNIPLCEDDVTLVKVIFTGKGQQHALTIIDEATTKPKLTSMMRMTAFPAAIISYMQVTGAIEKKGVFTQELGVPAEIFIKELAKRDIRIEGIDI